MKKFLIIIVVILFNQFCFSQTQFYTNIDGDSIYFKTVDTVTFIGFDYNSTSETKQSFINTIKNYTLQVDTIEETLFRIKFNQSNKSIIKWFINASSNINFYSPEYLNQDSLRCWTSGSIVLKYNNILSLDSLLNQLNINYLNIESDTNFTDYYTIYLSKEYDPFIISNQLYNTNLFSTVYPNFYSEIIFTDFGDNPLITQQFYLNPYTPDGSTSGVDAANVWDITTGNPNIKIAVLDNGVYKTHNDLVNNVIQNGFDATVFNGSPDLHGGADLGYSHGTKVTGVMVAENNTIGIVGIANTSKVFPIRIARSWKGESIDDDDEYHWYTQDNWIVSALQAAMDNNCSVINCSWHCIKTDKIEGKIDSISTDGRDGKGIPIVVATGNNPNGGDPYNSTLPCAGNTILYPASNENTISVGGCNNDETGFCNFGPGLDIVAPATGIYTTTYPALPNQSLYSFVDGTSMAVPIVSATIALMLSVNPNLTDSQIKEILYTSTNKLPSMYDILNTTELNEYGVWDWSSGYGMVNTHAAVVDAALYGIPLTINGNNSANLCDEFILSVPEFDIPEWVESVKWELDDNFQLIEQIDQFSIKVKVVGIGNGEIIFKIKHRNYTKISKKIITITSPSNNSYNSYEFEGVQSISSNALISGKNIVKPNSTLTISAQVHCTPNASIIVEPGGKLIINNGVLNSYCSDFPWKGIVVEGNSNSSQVGFSPNQGSLTMNNGIISNAKIGIMVGDSLTNTKSGGIITLTNSNFINNRMSIYMAPYKNMFNNGELRNRSTITNCSFIANTDFFVEQTNFFCHVYLNDVNGLIFNGCTFSSTMTIPQNAPTFISFPKTGIRSFNSGFTVRPTCNTSFYLGEVCPDENITSYSTFSGLDYGIVAISSGHLKKIEINSTHFLNNDYGIYINGVNNPKIVKNDFSVGKDNLNITSRPVGMYLQNSTGFRIEDNEFTNNTISTLDKIGLSIKNSRYDNNQVYNNIFTNLSIGQLFLGSNYNSSNERNDEVEGLVSICNRNYTNIQKDIRVEPILYEVYNGINPQQSYAIKINGEEKSSGANNLFTDSSGIVLQYDNNGAFINYYYNTNEALYKPTKFIGIQPMIAEYQNPCLSKIFGLYPSTINSELTSATLNYANLKYNYNQLIDAGNTEELLDLIQGKWSDDIWKLRSELMSKSPYLSQEAIYSVAMKNLLPPALLLEICLANPDATKREDFLDNLRYKIPNPLPEYMINLIKASWNQKTLRTELEEELSAFKTYRDEYQTYKTEILLSDTIYNYTDIINHLGSRGSFSDYLSMAEIAINQDDYTQANLYLDILENNNGKLSKEEAAEVESFRDYITIRESIFLDSTIIYNLDSTQIAALETFASSNNYRGAILARNILCFLYDICIDDVPAQPRMLRIGANANSGKNTTPYIASVRVLPNPANSYASFIWDMKSYDKPAILYIYDQTGKAVMTKEIENAQGQWIWDLKNIPSGVYVYTLKSDNLILYSGKVIVNK